jgi:hypothetical protein
MRGASRVQAPDDPIIIWIYAIWKVLLFALLGTLWSFASFFREKTNFNRVVNASFLT